MPAPPAEAKADAQLAATNERFEQLLAHYGHLIAAAIRRVGGDLVAGERDDIAQAVRVALWRRLADEQSIEHPASYVYKAAVRETVRAVTRLRARAMPSVDDASPEAVSVAAAPDRLVESLEQREALVAALRELPIDRARAVRAHLAGLSVDELMQLRGWSYQRARNLIARGMADLRLRLRQRGWS